jgi:hypothetical protein
MKNIFSVMINIMLAGIFIVAPSASWSQTLRFDFTEGNRSMDIPFIPASNLICLKVSVNGSEPGIFVLDTGAGYNVIDSAFAAKLGLDLSQRKTSPRTGISYSQLSELTFGLQGMKAMYQTAKAMPVAQLGAFTGEMVDGILGYDFIKELVFRIDYNKSLISFYDPKGFSYNGSGQRIPFELTEQNWPLTTIHITPQVGQPFDAKLIIDAGAIAPISINIPGLSNKSIPNTVTMGITGAGSGGCHGRLKAVSFGDLALKDPLAVMPTADAGNTKDPIAAMVGQVSAGNIGGELLRRFDVIFDYPGKVMILEPGREFKKPMEHDMCGAFLLNWFEPVRGFLVMAVTPGSPAEAAGIKQGDIITGIDGKKSEDITLTQARDLLKRNGKKVAFSINRDGQAMEISVKLKRMI